MTTVPVDSTYLIPGQQIDASDVVIPLLDLEHDVEGMLDGVYPFPKTVQVTAAIATLSSDAFSATQTYYALNTQGGANDELRTVTRPGQLDMVVIWKNQADPITINVRHSIGNILLDSGRDAIISDRSTALVLFWNATTSKWNGKLVNFGNIWFTGFPFVQINSDTITPTTNKLGVYAESGLTDNLATINHGSSPSQLDVLFLLPVSTYTITLKHNTGNIFFPSGRDVIMDATSDWVMLVWNDVTSKWHGQSSTELISQKYQTPFGQLNPASFLQIPHGTHLAGSSSASGIVTNIPTIQLLFRKKPVMVNEVSDFVTGGTGLASFGGTFTTTGTPSDALNAESQWITITSGAVVGNKAQRIGPVCAQLRWSPYFETSFLSWGNGVNSNGGANVDYGGLAGLFNITPAVGAAGITSWAGVSGIGFAYGLIQPSIGNGWCQLIQVDNGVVTVLVTPSTIYSLSPSQADSRPLTPTSSPTPIWSFYMDFANNRLHYSSGMIATFGSVAVSISPTLASVALAPVIFDAARTAAAVNFEYRHLLVNWRNM